jgi:hypothetical protein
MDEDRAKQRRAAKQKEMPLYAKILWAIPKNLVYILVGVILFAFLGMLYITYTEQNLKEFLTYDRNSVNVVVAPLYAQLRKSMELDKFKVPLE